MLKVLTVLLVATTVIACAPRKGELPDKSKGKTSEKTTAGTTQSESELRTLRQIHHAAVKSGVLILEDQPVEKPSVGTVRSIKISLRAVGSTEEEIQAAILVLKDYYLHVSDPSRTPEITDMDRIIRVEALENAMAELQTKRTGILTKKTDETAAKPAAPAAP